MKKIFLLFFLLFSYFVNGQGYNHQWLLGNWPTNYDKARMLFDSSNYLLTIEHRKMQFWGTEGNISDGSGNFLMSSNGVWIANANNDTMLNGSGLNPGPFVGLYPDGLLINYGNIFIPYPGDTLKYILIHQTGSPNNDVPSIELYYSLIDLALDSGLGGVYQKNISILQDTISWGISACKHANGRDWWVFSIKDSSNIVYKVLFTPNGISNIFTQSIAVPFAAGNASQLTFSKDGHYFAFSSYKKINNIIHNYINISDFDRCSGILTNTQSIDVYQGGYILGMTFSSNAQFIYAASSNYLFQINVSNFNIDTIAIYDGFYSIYPPAQTSFLFMYLAANGKIYITSGNSVQHIHEINFPDSAGIACDIQQHAINLGIWNFRAVPNHPNYYLGPVVGSSCDTLTGLNEHLNEIINFTLKPNPNNGSFSISYLLPQNKGGIFEVFDMVGKSVLMIPLPPWSSLQQIVLPKISDGVYNGVITSGGFRVGRKIVVIN